MKKIYTAILMLSLCGSSFAQGQNTGDDNSLMYKAPVRLMEQEPDRATNNNSIDSQRGSLIWSEDFADGFNSANGDWTVGGTNGNVWKHAMTIWSGCYAAGAQGSIDFTTQDNGFMLFHADSVNCVDPNSTPNPTITQESLIGELISPSINLADFPAVSVNFQHRFRYCCGGMALLLSVSNDGGDTWTNFDVTGNTAANAYNENTSPQVNISGVAGGQSDVMLKFTWNSTEESSHYTWSIDDVNLFVPGDYDLGITSSGYNDFDPATALSYRDIAYSIYPTSQLRNMVFKAGATNYGGMQQDDVQLRVVITDEDMNEVILLSDMVSLAAGESQEIKIESYTPPAEEGVYTVSFELISSAEDENPEDNVGNTTSFRVSDATYARDRYTSTGSFTNFDADYRIGTMYFFEDNAQLHCIGAGLNTQSVPETLFALEVRADDLETFIAESLPIEVPASAFLNAQTGGSHITWQFMEFPVPLFAGDDMFFGLYHYGGDEDVVISTSGPSPAQSSFFYEGSESTWYFITSTPMIRLGLSQEFCESVVIAEDPTISVDEIEMISVQELFPNPTEGLTTLTYSLLEASNVQIYLFDINGRIMMNQEMGTQSVGEHRFEYNWSNMSSGMYTLSIHVNGKPVNKKVIIK